MHMARPSDWLCVEDRYVWWHGQPMTHALVPKEHIELTSYAVPQSEAVPLFGK